MNKVTKKFSGIVDLIPYRNLLITVAVSFGITFFTEITNRRSLWEALKFTFIRPHLFLFNFIIIFFTLSITLLLKKQKAWLTFLGLFWVGFGVADFVVRCFRVTPFAATDLALLESVWTVMLIYLKVWQMILIAVAILLAIAGVVWLFVKTKKEKVDFKIAACAVTASAIMIFGLSTVYHAGAILPDRFTNLPDAYEENGFAYCFTVGLFDRGIDRPEDYSPENVDEILNSIGANTGNSARTKPNIIIVQLESFFDANYLSNVTFSKDPVPNFTALKMEYSNGFLSVPSIGSGTANTEFEVLSGMNLEYFGTAEYPYKTILQENTCETIAYNLKEQGYTAHAIHNHTGTFYDRNLVYANMGFDTFTSLEYMKAPTFNPIGWAKDAILTEEIITALDSTPNQDFIYAISVQAHGRYPRTAEDVFELGDIDVFGLSDEGDYAAYRYFVNQLHETDRFIGDLISALEERTDPYIIVFFGDHLPSLELNPEDIKNGDLYNTEYVVWSNFPIERRVKDLEAYQLSSYIMSLADFSNGIFTKLHQNYSDNENYQNALEMLEYDVLYGDYESYNGRQKYRPTSIKMGTRDIVIHSVKRTEEGLTIIGKNFTEYSNIIIDGKRIKTEFISEYSIKSAAGEIDPEEKMPQNVAVAQLTKNGEFLSEIFYQPQN